jgi:hypothetical protein
MTYIEINIEKKFINFYKIVDDYIDNILLLDNDTNIVKKICYECDYGSIEFIRYPKKSNIKKIIVHEIYVREQYRNQGLCKEFIKYLIDKSDKINIMIQSVLSKILYNFLLRFEYKEKKFIVTKQGFLYYK